MSKLFEIDLSLQTFQNTPGDLVAKLSHNGSYDLSITLKMGTMTCTGTDEASLTKDLLSCLRKMAATPVVPDLAIQVAAELLTDLPYSIVQLNDLMESQTEASPEEALAQVWNTLFPNTAAPEQAATQPTASPALDQEDFIDTPFGPIRVIRFGADSSLLGDLLSSLAGEDKEAEANPVQSKTPKFYS